MSALFAPPESRESSGMGSQREIERVDDEWSVQLPLNHKKKTQVWECEEEEQFCTTTTTTNVVQVDAEIVRQIQGRASITSRLVHVPTTSSPPRPNHTEYFWPVWTRLTRTIYRRVLHVRTSKCGWYPDPIMYIVWSPYVKGAYGCLGRREHSNREEVVLVWPRKTLKRFVAVTGGAFHSGMQQSMQTLVSLSTAATSWVFSRCFLAFGPLRKCQLCCCSMVNNIKWQCFSHRNKLQVIKNDLLPVFSFLLSPRTHLTNKQSERIVWFFSQICAKRNQNWGDKALKFAN